MNQKVIRQEILSQRNTLSSSDVSSASSKISNTLFEHPKFQSAKNIGVYFSFKNEIKTEDIIEYCLSNNKTVYLPVLNDETLLFRHYDKNTATQANKYGIHEPNQQSHEINLDQLDLIIVPLVACDHNGYRIGMGGGYYDRLLAPYNHKPYRLGIAYEFQYIKNAYPQSWDQAINTLITEQNIYNF